MVKDLLAAAYAKPQMLYHTSIKVDNAAIGSYGAWVANKLDKLREMDLAVYQDAERCGPPLLLTTVWFLWLV